MDYMMPQFDEEAGRRVIEEADASSTVAQEEGGATSSEDAGSARKGRTTLSAAARTARAVSEGLIGRAEHALGKAPDLADPLEKFARLDAHRTALDDSKLHKLGGALSKGPDSASRLGRFMEKATGSSNYVGQGLGAANYGLQFWENMAKGHDVGEAGLGALGGGFANGQMTKHLFSKPLSPLPGGKTPFKSNRFGPKAGWVDTGVNVLNAGLNLLGAPKEVTDFTQVAADATPSSFATSLASNAGRGLWNLGEGIFTGDWSGLQQQGEDITHGKAGAPLQGYGLGAELISNWGDGEYFAEATDEMRAGKRGAVPYYSLKLKDWVTDDAVPWVKDKVSSAVDAIGEGASALGGSLVSTMRDFITGNDGPTEMDLMQAAIRKGQLIQNKDKIMKQYGPAGEGVFTLMLNGQLAMPDYIK
jgi:hypothetical protein